MLQYFQFHDVDSHASYFDPILTKKREWNQLWCSGVDGKNIYG
jgi:hypothetical protein